MTRGWVLAAATLLGGCVYYNGMYNANRLASAAEKAEREGRPFEAQSNWAQAEVRADTVLARHRDSDWADDALLIKGKARLKQEDCPGAVSPLETVILTSPDTRLREEAALALAECRLRLGEPGSALSLLLPVLASQDEHRRLQAGTLEVRALNRVGRYADALTFLDDTTAQSHPAERLVALSGGGQVDLALALAESLRTVPRLDSTVAWDTVLAVLGRADLAAGSRLTDLLLARDSVPALRRGELLMGDARRWLARDTATAAGRLTQAGTITPPNQYVMAARLTEGRIALARATTLEDLDSAAVLLGRVQGTAGIEGLTASRLVEGVARVRAAFDSLGPSTANGDMETFLTAEIARDSLRAPAIAGDLYRRVGDLWPTSPYAPKALLALALVHPTGAEAYHAAAAESFPDSPYVQYLAGVPTQGLRVLEDSLRLYALSRLGITTPNRATPARRRRDQANDQPADELP